MRPEHPGVTVVIPTTGRPELSRAIASVRRQDYAGSIELIVIGDLPERALDDRLAGDVDVTLYTGGGRRGGAARNLGIDAATHPYVALVDDDDEWHPQKLTVQMTALAEHEADVVGTQVVYRNAETGTTSRPVPSTVKPSEQGVADYLFRRRSPKVGRPVICTSTLVARTSLAQQIRWDESLSRHQDWDWLDRLERGGARIVQIADPTTVVWTGSAGSISSSADWESSLRWATTRAGVWAPEVLADFLAGQTLRYAIQAHSPRGISRTLRAIGRSRRFPSARTWALGLGGFVPRSLINQLMSR